MSASRRSSAWLVGVPVAASVARLTKHRASRPPRLHSAAILSSGSASRLLPRRTSTTCAPRRLAAARTLSNWVHTLAHVASDSTSSRLTNRQATAGRRCKCLASQSVRSKPATAGCPAGGSARALRAGKSCAAPSAEATLSVLSGGRCSLSR